MQTAEAVHFQAPRAAGNVLGSLLVLVGFGLVVANVVQWTADVRRPAAGAADRAALFIEGPAEATLSGATETDSEVSIPGFASHPPAARAERIVVSSIGLDSAIAEVALKGGEWPVPKYIAGHLAESANPGDLGNAVFAGHILSLSSGNVFSRLEEIAVGDEITFWAVDDPRTFRVIASKLVRNTDVSVLAIHPGKATVTLITCAGRWVPADKDYDQRRVVVAEAVVA